MVCSPSEKKLKDELEQPSKRSYLMTVRCYNADGDTSTNQDTENKKQCDDLVNFMNRLSECSLCTNKNLQFASICASRPFVP